MVCHLSISCSNGSEFGSNKLDEFSFIYDINCIDLDTRPLADTTLLLPTVFPDDSSKHILFFADGNCSACIFNLITFLEDFSCSSHRDSLGVSVFLQATSLDLFEYYLEKSTLARDATFGEFQTATIKTCQVVSPPKTGAYLIIRKRIIRYDSWYPRH